MIEGVFWVEIHDFRGFLGEIILASVFWELDLRWDILGGQT